MPIVDLGEQDMEGRRRVLGDLARLDTDSVRTHTGKDLIGHESCPGIGQLDGPANRHAVDDAAPSPIDPPHGDSVEG
jgi:hypothetical protein